MLAHILDNLMNPLADFILLSIPFCILSNLGYQSFKYNLNFDKLADSFRIPFTTLFKSKCKESVLKV